ncbi:MAG: DegV family protein [Candidatus Dormibacteraeota bacterium]|uniref:DegV family protein n=1 Tax=Candidatus Aeolococcus gillhamiae TaxID=3127015 RepID=A0A934JW78_9BACT|nr:DegV family protein [Candidatus Dormibacteraeota bacterium]
MTSRRVGLVVDTGAALEQRIDGGRAVVAMHVDIGGASIDNSADGEVYVRLRRGEKATTSTPSPGEYLAAFEQLTGVEAIVCLTIPARWSGTFASATVAAGMFRDCRDVPTVDVVETPTAAVAYGLVARIADALGAAGADRDAVLARVRSACDEVRMYGALETLEYVARSGRVPALVAGVSDALHVRPVFEMHGGGTGRVALARTDAGVLRALERVARERLEPGRPHWLMLFHADAAERAVELRERLLAVCDVASDETVALAPVIGVYTGPGAVGFAALPVHATDPPAVTQ